MRKRLLAAVAVACALMGAPALAGPGWTPPPGGVGLNLYTVGQLYQSIPFSDLMKDAQPWRISYNPIAPGTAVAGKTTLDANGWPQSLQNNQSVIACAFSGEHGYYPAGQYTLTYQGSGTVVLQSGGGPNRVTLVSSAPGTQVYQVTPSPGAASDAGLCVRVTATTPGDYIRDIAVMLPGYAQAPALAGAPRSSIWYQPFLAELAPFQYIRFIGWSQANKSAVVNWADRRPITYAQQAWSYDTTTAPVTFTGVALEYQIALANALHANPWFNIPTEASDDYITQMAQLVKAQLDPTLHPMIEFSNEIWNGSFPDHAYAQAQGAAANLDTADGASQPWAWADWYAQRAARMFVIWDGVYGASAKNITHIVGVQSDWPAEAQHILSYQGLAAHADVIATGAYVSPYSWGDMTAAQIAAVAAKTPAQVVADLQAAIPAEMKSLAGEVAVAKSYGLGTVVYEGGPGLQTSAMGALGAPYATQITTLFTQASAGPSMATAYQALLDQASAAGVLEFNHFCDVEWPSGYGDFGALTYQDQPTASSPIYQGLLAYRAQSASALSTAAALAR